MELRSATLEDLPAIRILVARVGREFGFEPEPEGADLDLYGDPHAYFAPGGMLRVLVGAADVVGVVGVVQFSDTDWELRKIYLSADHRSAGHGSSMLEAAVAFARSQGARRLLLQSSSKLGAALRLYERAGFERVQRGTRSNTCDVSMELILSSWPIQPSREDQAEPHRPTP